MPSRAADRERDEKGGLSLSLHNTREEQDTLISTHGKDEGEKEAQ